MAKKPSTAKLSDAEQIEQWMQDTRHLLKEQIDELRSVIKKADKRIGERIKWNAPSYYFNEDIVTFGPERKGQILLVFHHPHVVKIKSDLLEGDYKDRRLVYFDSPAAVKAGKKEITRIVKEIVDHIASR